MENDQYINAIMRQEKILTILEADWLTDDERHQILSDTVFNLAALTLNPELTLEHVEIVTKANIISLNQENK